MKSIDKNMQDLLKFIYSATEACKDATEVDFDCPVCGGKAHAVKSGCSGHIHANCMNCDMNMMQ